MLRKAGVVEFDGVADRAPGLVLNERVAGVELEGRTSDEGAGNADEGKDERGGLRNICRLVISLFSHR